MTEETIVIEIDDSQLDVALIKLDLVGQLSKETTGKKDLSKGLPGINRELRLILGRIPGMREAISAYFRIKRIERGLEFGSLEALIGSATSFQGILTIVATTLIIVQFLMQKEKKREKEAKQLKLFIMKERGVNQAGFTRLLSDWQKSFRGIP